MRPDRLASARSRLGGGALARLVQATDVGVLATVFYAGRLTHAADGSTGFVLAATFLVVATLGTFEAYKFGAREHLFPHLYRVIGGVGAAALLVLTVASLGAPAAKAANIPPIVDWCLSIAAGLSLTHLGWFTYIRRLRKQGALTPNLIIVGATPAAERLIGAALGSRDVNILGVFDDRGGARRPQHLYGVPVLGRTADVKTRSLMHRASRSSPRKPLTWA